MAIQNALKPGTVLSLDPQRSRRHYVMDAIVDTNLLVYTAGDSLSVLNLPAHSAIQASGIEVMRVATTGTTGTYGVRLAGSAKGTAAVATALGYISVDATFANPTTASRLIDVITATAAANALIRVVVVAVDMSDSGSLIAVGQLNGNPVWQSRA